MVLLALALVALTPQWTPVPCRLIEKFEGKEVLQSLQGPRKDLIVATWGEPEAPQALWFSKDGKVASRGATLPSFEDTIANLRRSQNWRRELLESGQKLPLSARDISTVKIAAGKYLTFLTLKAPAKAGLDLTNVAGCEELEVLSLIDIKTKEVGLIAARCGDFSTLGDGYPTYETASIVVVPASRLIAMKTGGNIYFIELSTWPK